jgi:hypothetical protein
VEGRTTRNIAPRGFDAANEILPPCRSRIVWQMAKPSPVPCDFGCCEGVENIACFGVVNPRACIFDLQEDCVIRLSFCSERGLLKFRDYDFSLLADLTLEGQLVVELERCVANRPHRCRACQT